MLKITTKFLIIFLSILSLNLTISTNNANANMFNKFKKGFYFEKYKTAEEAKEALLKLHPIGSDVEGLVKMLEVAGAECVMGNNKTNEIINKITEANDFYQCNYKHRPIFPIHWRVNIYLDIKDLKIKEIHVISWVDTI